MSGPSSSRGPNTVVKGSMIGAGLLAVGVVLYFAFWFNAAPPVETIAQMAQPPAPGVAEKTGPPSAPVLAPERPASDDAAEDRGAELADASGDAPADGKKPPKNPRPSDKGAKPQVIRPLR